MVLHSILSTRIVLHLFTVAKQDLVESQSSVRYPVSRRIQFMTGTGVLSAED